MKKHFLKLITMLSLIFSLLSVSCQNSFKFSNNQKPKDFVTVYFCNDGFAGRSAGESIFMPEENILARAKKFELSGTYTGNGNFDEEYKKLTAQVFTQLSDLSSFTKDLVAGAWTFTLNAYSEYSETPFYADEVNIEISNTSYTVEFNLQPVVQDGGTGQLKLKFNFPENNVTKVSYMFYKVNSDLGFEPGDLGTVINPVKIGDVSVAENTMTELSYGNYVMLISLYSDTPQADTFMGDFSVYFVIQTGLVTTVEKTFENLISYWKVTLNGNGVDLKDEVKDFFYYTAYNDIVLPTKSVFDEVAASGKFFTGWKTSQDDSGSTLTQWQNGTVTGNITLYASWLDEPPYKVKFLDGKRDYFSGEMDEITTSGSSLNSGSISIAQTPNYDTTDLTLTPEEESNIPVFEGWYTNPSCETKIPLVDGLYKLDLTGSDDLVHDDENRTVTLYAKWNYKLVYLDPQNATDDSKSGFTAANAVKTVEEAKWLTCNDVDTDVIYVMSGISTKSEIENLSNTKAVVKRESSNTSYLINIPTTETSIELSDVVLDGGYNGVDKRSDIAVIFSTNNDNLTSLTLTNLLIQNHYGKTSAVDIGRLRDTLANITIKNCTFINNTNNMDSMYTSLTYDGGGAIRASGKSVTFDGCTFNNNHTNSYGGAITMVNGSFTFANKNIFENNTANVGGAINGISFTPKSAKLYFISNTAQNAAAFYVRGSSSLSFSNATFESNVNEGNTNSSYIVKGMSFSSCTFKQNKVNKGSVVTFTDNGGFIENCTFTNNRTQDTNYFDINAPYSVSFSGTNIFTNEEDITIPNIYLAKSATCSGNLSVQNGIKMEPDNPIVIGSTGLLPVESNTKIATLFLSKYEVDMQVLDLTSSGTAVIPYFTISDPAYRIDENGYLTFKYSASGVIGNPFDSKVVLAVDKTTVNIDGKLLFTSKIGDNPVGLTDWFVTAEYYSIEKVALDLTDQIIDGASSMELDLNKAGIIYKGSYLFTVSGFYSGIKYSEEFLVTVE